MGKYEYLSLCLLFLSAVQALVSCVTHKKIHESTRAYFAMNAVVAIHGISAIALLSSIRGHILMLVAAALAPPMAAFNGWVVLFSSERDSGSLFYLASIQFFSHGLIGVYLVLFMSDAG